MSFQVAKNIIDHVKEKELGQLLYDNHKKKGFIDMGDDSGVKTITSWNKKNLARFIEKYLTADLSHLTFRMPLKEIQDFQKLLHAGGGGVNNLLRRALKGNTLGEVIDRNAYGQIDLQMETRENIDKISYLSFVKSYINFLQIENDDPCFCGSGKRYKDCCGDN